MPKHLRFYSKRKKWGSAQWSEEDQYLEMMIALRQNQWKEVEYLFGQISPDSDFYQYAAFQVLKQKDQISPSLREVVSQEEYYSEELSAFSLFSQGNEVAGKSKSRRVTAKVFTSNECFSK